MVPLLRRELTVTEKLNFQVIPIWVLEVAERLIQANFQAYLVGGAVRDLLWGEEPNDWDMASDALPEQVAQIFPGALATGQKFGTMTVIYNGSPLELTTLREDLGYSDGRHPGQVRFGKDIGTDLSRRDFTINAIAYDLSSRELIDPFDGIKDIRRRQLKAVGPPSLRFREDGLRMFRFYRFLATLDLKADRLTEQSVNPEWIEGVSFERIRDELNKLLLGKEVGRALRGLKKSGLLESFLPEFKGSERLEQGMSGNSNLWEHSLNTVINIRPQLNLRLAALFHDIAKPLTRTENQSGVHFYGHDEQGAEIGRRILTRLRYPRKMIDKVAHLIRWHMFFLNQQSNDGAIRRLIAKAGPDSIADLLELRRADIVATGKVDYQTWEYWQSLSGRITEILNNNNMADPFTLAIKGRDLISHFQLSPGPLVGEILDHLREIVLDDPAINQRPELLKRAREYIQSPKNH